MEIDEKKMHERMMLVGSNMMRKHLQIRKGRSENGEEAKGKILTLDEQDRKLLIDTCIFHDLDSLPLVLNTLYPNNSEKKYNIIEQALPYLYKNKYKHIYNQSSIEVIFHKFELHDGEKNFHLLKQFILQAKGSIECSNIHIFGLKNDIQKKEIVMLLLLHSRHDNILPYFHLMKIRSEEIRFEIAKKVAEKEGYIGKYLENFGINDTDKLRELADINSQHITPTKGEKKVVNPQFINYAKKFMLSGVSLIERIDATLTPDTIFKINESGMTQDELLLPMIQKVISLSSNYYTLDENIGHIFSYIKTLSEEKKLLYLSELGKYLTARSNTKNIIKTIKEFVKNSNITQEEFENIFVSYFTHSLQKQVPNNSSIQSYLNGLTYMGYGEDQVSPFNTRKDILIFIQALEKGGYIDHHIRKALLSENHHFEHLKNFLFLIFEDTSISKLEYKSDTSTNKSKPKKIINALALISLFCDVRTF
ncbi:hypothetical protein MK079_03380 [Candidatus Gracilibacteria bacterium]|nr:hypothetical protein [Candidatus Gracilibacteria bacterium]